MLAEYRQLGQHTTPIWPLWGNETWCMIGYHSVDMIAEAYLDGFRGFDAEAAYQAMRDTAMQDRNGLDTYKQLGYVRFHSQAKRRLPAHSNTLSTTGASPAWPRPWAMRRMPGCFISASANYRNLFDRTTRLFPRAQGRRRLALALCRQCAGQRRIHRGGRLAICLRRSAGCARHDCALRRRRGIHQEAGRLCSPPTTNIDTTIPDISGLIGQDSQGDEQCHHVPFLYDSNTYS